MGKGEGIESQILNQISTTAIDDLAIDIGEIALDAITDIQVLKEIPILSTISSIVKVTSTIRERIFTKKILMFLKSLKDCNIKQRVEFIDKLNKSPREKQKVGEAIIVLLDQSDDMEKPGIIGNLFKAYIQEFLTYSEFHKICSIVNKVHLADLTLLRKNSGVNLPIEVSEALMANGLMTMGILEEPFTFDKETLSPKLFYVKNKIASKLLKFGFE